MCMIFIHVVTVVSLSFTPRNLCQTVFCWTATVLQHINTLSWCESGLKDLNSSRTKSGLSTWLFSVCLNHWCYLGRSTCSVGRDTVEGTQQQHHDWPQFPDWGGARDNPGCAEKRCRAEEGRRAAYSVSVSCLVVMLQFWPVWILPIFTCYLQTPVTAENEKKTKTLGLAELTSLFSRTYCELQLWRHFSCVSPGSCRRLWVTGVCWGTWLVNGSTRPSSFATRIAFMALISSGHQWNRLRGRWPYVSVLTFDCMLLTERHDLGVLKQQPGIELILLWSLSLFISSVYSKSLSKVRLI